MQENDWLAICAFIYIFLSVSIAALIPSEVYSGTSTSMSVDSSKQEVGTVYKMVSFLFASWSIEGIPAIAAIFISLLNYVCLFIGILYIAEKIRAFIGFT